VEIGHDSARATGTATGPLRRRFMQESDKRWRVATRIIGEAVGQQDILGLGGATMASVALGATGVHHPPLPQANKIAGFAHWLGGARQARCRTRRQFAATQQPRQRPPPYGAR
jgi:hypothetical protein